MPRQADTIAEVVQNGLCIGCGLCESVSGGRATMTATDYGSLRPSPVDAFTPEEESELLAACPGVMVEPRQSRDGLLDNVWGQYAVMQYAWAGDPKVRFQGATAGVLTTLGQWLLTSGTVSFVLQVRSDPANPARNQSVISESADDVLAHAGSRYAPVAPLAQFDAALERDEPFALIAKPCDLNAVHQRSKQDARVDALCVARLAMVCGGQSRHTKTRGLLDDSGIDEADVSLLRYRGFGNPGPTRVEAQDGRCYETTYLDLWADEGSWDLETRCKICPDPLGECADIAVADVWPGGAPTGEDEGFSGVIVRSPQGQRWLKDAADAGKVILGDAITPRQFDDFQPHQRRKKLALKARYDALNAEGRPTIATPGLRVDTLSTALLQEDYQIQFQGTRDRIRQGRMDEPANFSDTAGSDTTESST